MIPTTLFQALAIFLSITACLTASLQADDEFRPVPLKSAVTKVQPLTGIVLWTTNAAVETSPIQLEYAYLTYRDVMPASGQYDWSALERLLDDAAGRGHQLILRWHDTYVGKPTGVPKFLTSSPGYRLTRARSEGKMTEFPDWSSRELQQFALDFFSEFARRYDRDPRLAYVQAGFGLWAEYHIYDGPMKLGQTFPSHEFQGKFLRHLATTLKETPWMISVDSASEHGPFESDRALLELPFGVFDDSFNHRRHRDENEPNWNALVRTRWQTSPCGGEFSFFEDVDQKKALAARGPHGTSFEDHARSFHLTFIIGDAQPEHQTADRIREAGQAMGYRLRVIEFEASKTRSRVRVENIGIAPLYYDAFVTLNGVRAEKSLKGLLPGESRSFEIAAGGPMPRFTIESDRLVQGQRIEFDADLMTD